MERVNLLSGQMPDAIRACVSLTISGTPQEFRMHFKNKISHLSELARRCQDAAQDSESMFAHLVGLNQVIGNGASLRVPATGTESIILLGAAYCLYVQGNSTTLCSAQNVRELMKAPSGCSVVRSKKPLRPSDKLKRKPERTKRTRRLVSQLSKMILKNISRLETSAPTAL